MDFCAEFFGCIKARNSLTRVCVKIQGKTPHSVASFLLGWLVGVLVHWYGCWLVGVLVSQLVY
jgi:hypothetical protein